MNFRSAVRLHELMFLCPSCLRSLTPLIRGISKLKPSSRTQKIPNRPSDSVSLRGLHSNSKNDYSSFTKRTHGCGRITSSDIDKTVRLYGWLQYNRMAGSSCQFLILRDWTGIVQVAVPQSMITDEILSLSTESVLEVSGKVQKRPEGQENKTMETGSLEIIPSEIKVINKSRPSLPIFIADYQQSKEDLRLKYRYLDLRRQDLQRNLRLRSEVIMKIREYLCGHGFVDVETPTLFRRTPGGAKEFVVPSHYPGQFYSLPQSPQQFKQLLMVGGLDRYFQIARCYRDESIKMDRQPEFTQVDIELSFTTQEEVQHLVEELINRSWPVDKGQITPPFPVITYEQAMNDYGIDKPDTRFDLKLVDISEETRGSGFKLFDDILTKEHGKVVAIRLPKTKGVLSNKEIETLRNSPLHHINLKPAVIKVDKGKWESPLSKHLSEDVKEKLNKKLQIEDGDLVFMAAGENYTPNEILGRLRLEAAKILDKKGIYEVKLQDPTKNHFLWVIDFPMFLPKEDPEVGGSEVESAHHPFTAPHPEDQHLIYTHPMKVRSQHYDLVLNGNEIGGGSIRIHNSELQRYIIENILKEDSSELEHLLEALSYGAPPHGGIALGLDRLLAIICEASSIREVIAFPKSAEGKDHMSEAPSEISDKDLELYHIQVKK